MKEYGSFFELDLRKDNEFYRGSSIKRLNTARCGIYYVLRLLGLNRIILPYYLCPSVRNYLLTKNVDISYSDIGEDFLPILPDTIGGGTAVLVVNYFGLISREKIGALVSAYPNVIVDHSQAFYKLPFKEAYTVYSPRKFFGVPDGCYVVGEHAGNEDFKLPQDYSSETSLFLLKRIEKGCEETYLDRMKNEARLDAADIAEMSVLSRALLNNIDYETIRKKRVENFLYAHSLFSGLNQLDLNLFFPLESDTVPMVYPLIIDDEKILPYLQRNKVFIGRWWLHVTDQKTGNSLETRFSKYMLPLPIDQRMEKTDIDRLYRLIVNRNNQDALLYQSEK